MVVVTADSAFLIAPTVESYAAVSAGSTMHFVFESRATKNGAHASHLPVVTVAAFVHLNDHL
jgi:hypothetical protein